MSNENLETAIKKHDQVHKEVEKLEKIREVDRSAETKAKLLQLKKEKLHLKDEIAMWQRVERKLNEDKNGTFR